METEIIKVQKTKRPKKPKIVDIVTEPKREVLSVETSKNVPLALVPKRPFVNIGQKLSQKSLNRIVTSETIRTNTRKVKSSVKKSNKGTKDSVVANIVKRIADIDDSNSVQISSGFNVVKTMPSAPYASQGASFGSSVYAPQFDTFGFGFRSLCRANIFYQSTYGLYTYQAYACSSIEPSAIGTYQPPSSSFVVNIPSQNIRTPIDVKYAICTSSAQPHGPILFGGSDGNTMNRYLWMDNGLNISASATWGGGASGVSCVLGVYKFNGSGSSFQVQEIVALTTTGGLVTFIGKLIDYGYMRFTITQTSIVTENAFTFSNLSWTSDNGDSVIQHLPAPGYAENYLTTTSFKQYGANLMLSNEAALNNMQGKIACLQASSGRMWTDFMVPSTGGYDVVASSNGYKWFKAMDGAYSFLKPESEKDYEFFTECKIVNNVLMDCAFDITSRSPFLCIYAVVTDTSGQDFVWSRWQSLELISTNMWFSLSEGTQTEAQFNEAIQILKYMPQHYENPLHVGQILSAIASGARGVQTVIDMAAKYGSPLLKFVGGLA